MVPVPRPRSRGRTAASGELGGIREHDLCRPRTQPFQVFVEVDDRPGFVFRSDVDEELMRAILTPNAAMEAGYRAFRVELKGGDVLDGLLVSQDKEAIILRQPNREDQRILQEKIVRAGYTKTSIMPEGLLDAMPTPDVTDLFTYLKTLK